MVSHYIPVICDMYPSFLNGDLRKHLSPAVYFLLHCECRFYSVLLFRGNVFVLYCFCLVFVFISHQYTCNFVKQSFTFFHFSVRGRQTITRGPGDDGGETEREFYDITSLLCARNNSEAEGHNFLTLLQEKNTALYRPALEELRRQIRSSTTSMTSVPKPLKFLRPHYGKLKEIFEGMAPGENKVCFFFAARTLKHSSRSTWKWNWELYETNENISLIYFLRAGINFS